MRKLDGGEKLALTSIEESVLEYGDIARFLVWSRVCRIERLRKKRMPEAVSIMQGFPLLRKPSRIVVPKAA